MSIGQAASASGVSAKMICHQEGIDLIQVAGLSEGGYRIYGKDEVHGLHFIHQARTRRFPVEQIRLLLALWRDQHRASAEVKAIAAQHVAELDTRIAELVAKRDTRAHLARHCEGDQWPSCPIRDEIARGDGPKLARRESAQLKTATLQADD